GGGGGSGHGGGREGPLGADRRHPADRQDRRRHLGGGQRAARSVARADLVRGPARVSPAKASDAAEVAHPRETFALLGHAEAERALLDEYRSGRIAHAWLIGGPAGIGKATLAYRMARFVLTHRDPLAPAVQKATTLAVPPESPVARRVTGRAHPDLLVLEREPDDEGKMRTVITVDQVRRTVGFFGATAGEGGWRVCIVARADELQSPQGSNALLKVLEEPPPRSLFLVVSHAPGRLLPTIRSRCRRLTLRALDEED